MKPTTILCVALAALLLSGCFGVAPGAAGPGDTVTIQYDAAEIGNATLLRENRTATFVVGSGTSGLGLGLERALRGHLPNETFQVAIRGDSSLRFLGVVEVDRALPAIQVHQEAPRSDFESYVGPATIGQDFPAYGIYTGIVTALNDTTVQFDVHATDGQRAPVPSVGCTLVTVAAGDELHRSLEPNVGAIFAVAEPSPFAPRTPLGLQPGTYKVLGATDGKIRYSHALSTEFDLVGKDLAFTVTVVKVLDGDQVVAPVKSKEGTNYAVRSSPEVNGDPSSVLGGALPDHQD